jgi:2-C-methyl-D-erythritol 4-phosphate cytidylyltransferase
VVILAAGSGSRVGAAVNKVLLPLRDRPVLTWSIRAALATPGVDPVVVVCRRGEERAIAEAVTPALGDREVLLTTGGATRHQSERAALQLLRDRISAGRVEVVAIHDGARPLVTPELFTELLDVAREAGGAVPTRTLPGLLPREPGGDVSSAEHMVGVQTPQAFDAPALLAAYDAAAADDFEGTDTAACLERYTDIDVRAVPARPENLKVTWPGDLAAAEVLLRSREGGEDPQILD